jgi:undecaprenyl-diphosphatase
MSFWQAVSLGILQGITEFLPISSSGHLLLLQDIFNLTDGVALKAFDISVHFGTLLVIFIYFRKDFLDLIKAAWMLVTRKKTEGAEQIKWLQTQKKLIIILILGTIPAVLVGLFLGDTIDQYLLNPVSVSVMLIIVALFFLLAERVYKGLEHTKNISMRNGLLIGAAQALALIPGVSRSGSTITTGLFLGINREKAARFSFILGSVAMFAAFAYALMKVGKGEYSLPPIDMLITGIVSSFISGWFAVKFLLNYLKKSTLAVFAYYRIALALVFLGWIYLF